MRELVCQLRAIHEAHTLQPKENMQSEEKGLGYCY